MSIREALRISECFHEASTRCFDIYYAVTAVAVAGPRGSSTSISIVLLVEITTAILIINIRAYQNHKN